MDWLAVFFAEVVFEGADELKEVIGQAETLRIAKARILPLIFSLLDVLVSAVKVF